MWGVLQGRPLPWNAALTFPVEGDAKPKGSPSIVLPKKPGARPFVHESAAGKKWQRQVRDMASTVIIDPPLDQPCALELVFYLPPQKGKVRADTKPDIDKLTRTVLDALEGIAYTQDSRVVDVHAIKIRDRDETPRVEITLRWESPRSK